MNKSLIAGLLLVLSVTACSTPKTVLKHPETKQVATCGGSSTGSLVGGVLGYHIEKANDADCVSDYASQGFKVIKSDKDSKF